MYPKPSQDLCQTGANKDNKVGRNAQVQVGGQHKPILGRGQCDIALVIALFANESAQK